MNISAPWHTYRVLNSSGYREGTMDLRHLQGPWYETPNPSCPVIYLERPDSRDVARPENTPICNVFDEDHNRLGFQLFRVQIDDEVDPEGIY